MTEIASDPTQTVALSDRIVQFFFMHIGSFVAVIVYFILCERTAYSPSGVQAALLTGLIVMSGYIAFAYLRDELKQFDYGLWAMFALGTLGAYAGISSGFTLFQHYSAAMLFFTLGLVTLIPLLLGYETFLLCSTSGSALATEDGSVRCHQQGHGRILGIPVLHRCRIGHLGAAGLAVHCVLSEFAYLRFGHSSHLMASIALSQGLSP